MMTTETARTWRPTHEVLNQVPPLLEYNLFEQDAALKEGLEREGAGWAAESMHELGRILGTAEVIEWGIQANSYPPVLRTHDRRGHRIDEVEFHPAWHQLMGLSIEKGLHCSPWEAERDGSHAARAAAMMLVSQNEAGHACPISMTYSVVSVLRQHDYLSDWKERICTRVYDKRMIPAGEKRGVIFGMGMTEKQGGSDVRANTTQAVPSGSDHQYAITGHKWFCSAPMSDAFLVLAQAPGGLSCFLLPRFTPDGQRNRFFIQRLKDKLGNKSNASSEVEFQEAYAVLVGEEGRGARTIIDMVSHTRLDCTIMSAALMRQSLVQAIHHCRHRKAFGKLLVDQPLMRNVLTDLAVESEAATLLTMRLAGAYDRAAAGCESESHFRRIATAVAKYWLSKRAPVFVVEALECLGGAGYVEESPMPRLYREAPLASIWEGSGNVICLDVLRAMEKEQESVTALLAEIELAHGMERRFDTFVENLKEQMANRDDREIRARLLVEALALALQASLLLRHSPRAVAETFIASRLDSGSGRAFGTLPAALVKGDIIDRQWS